MAEIRLPVVVLLLVVTVIYEILKRSRLIKRPENLMALAKKGGMVIGE